MTQYGVVRDIVGHIGVWNGEAAKSIRAHTEGCEYHCIESEASYDEYNGIAVNERRSWNIDQVWDEYKESYVQLELSVKQMPVKKWDREMLYPWNERGSLRNLIEIMMIHEVEHRDKIRAG